ncbi:MAG: glycosyltransferase family 4 protein [Candidatus Neomarinimicrobiota bacterium]
MEKKINVAIYSGIIPAPNFIENLIKLIGDKNINIYLFGNGGSVKYKNSNIKTFFTPQGKLKIICFVFFQLLRLFIFYPKKLYKLIRNYKVFTKSGSIFISLSKILPVLNYTPDIFHIQWAKSLPFWFFLKEIYGVKIVLSLRGSHINYSAFANDSLAKNYNILFPNVDRMHAVSKKILLKAEKYGASRDKTDIIYSSLDLGLLKTYKKNNSKPHRPFRFLSVGRFHWVKGYQYSISAFANLKKINKDIHYIIITNNSISEEILYQIDDLSLKNNIEIIHPDSQDKVYEIMRQSDCLVLPSVQEGISNVVLESMAIGLPVISSDCGGMKEIINYGRNGFYFPSRDSVALEKLLLKVMNLGIEERERIISEGEKFINQNLNMTLIKSQFHDFYKKTTEIGI